jgi:hypothetical protein
MFVKELIKQLEIMNTLELNGNTYKATDSYGLTTFSQSFGGANTAFWVDGKAFVFNVNGFKIVKEVRKNSTKFLISGNNIKEQAVFNKLDIKNIDSLNETAKKNQLTEIMNTDITEIKKVMNNNKKAFIYFMKDNTSKGMNKSEAFATTIKEFLSDKFNFNYETEKAIIKVMIKYGYEFTTTEEATKLFKN